MHTQERIYCVSVGGHETVLINKLTSKAGARNNAMDSWTLKAAEGVSEITPAPGSLSPLECIDDRVNWTYGLQIS